MLFPGNTGYGFSVTHICFFRQRGICVVEAHVGYIRFRPTQQVLGMTSGESSGYCFPFPVITGTHLDVCLPNNLGDPPLIQRGTARGTATQEVLYVSYRRVVVVAHWHHLWPSAEPIYQIIM